MKAYEELHLETKICRRCRNPYMSEYTESEMCKKCENLVSIVKHGIRLKHCIVCDKPFEMKSNNSRYCSKDCKKEARNLRDRERRRKEKKNKVKKCGYCSKEYEPSQYNRKYCSKECGLLAKKEQDRMAREQKKRRAIKKTIENRPDLENIKPKDKGYKIRRYIVKTYSDGESILKFERDFNYFKPCKFDKNNKNLYYIHDFNDSDLSSSLIKYADTSLSEKEFEYYNLRGNLVFYEMLT